MQYDIKIIESWSPPEHNGLELLGMPNIPHGLHGVAPRTVLGPAKWNLMRKKCYMDAGYRCEICGAALGHSNCQAHEVFRYDFKAAEATFVRPVCVCTQCVDEDTEVLTSEGWTKIPDVTLEHKIACWDTNNEITFQHPTATMQSVHEKAIKISHKDGELFFSPNHRLLLKIAAKNSPTYGQYKDVLAKDYVGSHYYNWLRCANNPKKETLSIEERIFIALEADGSITYDKEKPRGKEREQVYNNRYSSADYRYTFHISLYKNRKIKRLDWLLEQSSLKHEVVKASKSGYKEWNIWTNVDCKHFKSFLNVDMGSEKAQEFLEEIVFWDGAYSGGHTSWFTNKPEEADFVQAVATQTNIKATIGVVNRLGNLRKGQWNTPYERLSYNVSLCSMKIETTGNLLKSEEIEWGKPMYCISVPTTYFVARRQGFVFITGNCHQGFLHSGRQLTLYANQGSDAPNKMDMLKAVGDRFKLIAEYNRKHPEAPIRVSDTFIEWSKTIGLSTSMKAFFESYDVKFAKPYDTKKWRVWRLKIGNEWYESPYKTRKDWEEKYAKK